MRTIKPYPHIDINVEDVRPPEPVTNDALPIFRPLFITRAQKGRLNKPVWCGNYNAAMKEFGAKTFDRLNSTYYTREAEYLRHVFEGSGAFVVRVAQTEDDTDPANNAKKAALGISATVIERGSLPVYYRNADGEREVDSNGEYSKIDSESVIGTEIIWTARTLGDDKTPQAFLDAKPTDGTDLTSGTESGCAYKTYPIMVAYTDNPGAWGNDLGFSLFYDQNNNDEDQYARIGTPMISFSPYKKPDNVVQAIPDAYNNSINTFSPKEDVVDPNTGMRLSLQDMLDGAYADGRLPFSIEINQENWKKVAEKCIEDVPNQFYETDWTYVSGNEIPLTLDETANSGTTTLSVSDDLASSSLTTSLSDGDLVAVSGLGVPYGTTITEIDADNGTVTISRPLHESILSGETISAGEPTVDVRASEITEDTANPWSINILTGINPETGNHYTYTIVSTEHENLLNEFGDDSVVMNPTIKNTSLYLGGGTDGDMSDKTFENLMSSFLSGNLVNDDGSFTDLRDAFRYPFNYLFDTGYTLDIKRDLLDFMSVRDDVRVSISPQIPDVSESDPTYDWSTRPTQPQSVVTGSILRDYALLQLESVLKGTHACRAAIFGQSGTVAGLTNRDWFPMTLWDAWIHARLQATNAIREIPEGRPLSEVTLFDDVSFVPSYEDTRSRLWTEGINYVQYYNRTGLFFPAIRSVYDYENSGLLNNTFVDAVVYTKQIAKVVWTIYSGVSIPFTELAGQIRSTLGDRLSILYNGRYNPQINVYKTDVERQLGYVVHIEVHLTSPNTHRVILADIISDNTTQEEA